MVAPAVERPLPAQARMMSRGNHCGKTNRAASMVSIALGRRDMSTSFDIVPLSTVTVKESLKLAVGF